MGELCVTGWVALADPGLVTVLLELLDRASFFSAMFPRLLEEASFG